MKQIKDLTKEQVIEIAKLVYPFNDWIKSDIEVKYQPYDKTWLDPQEYWFVKFDGITFGDKVDTYRLWIYPTLNLEFDAIRKHPDTFTEANKMKVIESGNDQMVMLGSFPLRNQYFVQKKFMEWNIEPVFEREEEKK